jgi:hypothetical protein
MKKYFRLGGPAKLRGVSDEMRIGQFAIPSREITVTRIASIHAGRKYAQKSLD